MELPAMSLVLPPDTDHLPPLAPIYKPINWIRLFNSR
jgi:hypothetical protein